MLHHVAFITQIAMKITNNKTGTTMSNFINKFCRALDIEVPKNEKTSDIVCGLAMCWAMVLLGYATMRLVYGG